MPLRRLAIDASRAVLPTKTGTEWYSVEVIRALAALPARPAIDLYAGRSPAPGDVPPELPLHVKPFPRLWTHLRLSAAMAGARPDALFVPSHVVPAYHPRASVVTIHDLGYRFYPATHPRRQRMMLDLATRWNARVARRIIAISQSTRDDLLREYHIPPERVVVVHSGVSASRFHPIEQGAKAATLRRLQVTEPYVLAVSTVHPRKNLHRLVQAFKLLGHPELTLVIAGRMGWGEAGCVGVVGDESVRLLGYVASNDLPALYSGAAIFALPSLYEGFGMWVLEAMACGCPVVTSNVSSLPEVAGDAAILVDPLDPRAIADGLARALQPDERERLVRAGLRRATMFTWERAARRTLAVIEDAVDDG